MVNYLAVLVAAVAAYVLGFLWYGPLFGKKWMQLMNLTGKDKEKAKQKEMVKAYVATFVTNLVTAYVLAWFVGYVGMTPAGGAMTGAVAWLGFLATSGTGMVLWENKPWALYALNMGHSLLSLVVMGAIVGAWA